jgi:hypothetical protein
MAKGETAAIADPTRARPTRRSPRSGARFPSLGTGYSLRLRLCHAAQARRVEDVEADDGIARAEGAMRPFALKLREDAATFSRRETAEFHFRDEQPVGGPGIRGDEIQFDTAFPMPRCAGKPGAAGILEDCGGT